MPGPWGKAIEHLRLSKKFTREQVAKRAKMTATTYGRIERGQHTQTRKLQDIADVFGVPIEAVLQFQPLQSDVIFRQTQAGSQGSRDVIQGNSLSPAASASEVQALRAEVGILQQQLAEIVAQREASARRRRRKPVPTAGARKPARPAHARKPS